MRRFKVYPSTKIQAGPVNFDDLDKSYAKNRRGPNAVEAELEASKGEIISHAKSVFEKLASDLNNDIATIYEKYLSIDESGAFDEFFELSSSGHIIDNEPSNVLYGIRFTLLDYGNLWAQIAPDGASAPLRDITEEFYDAHIGGKGEDPGDHFSLSDSSYVYPTPDITPDITPVVEAPKYYNNFYKFIKLLLTKKYFYSQFEEGQAKEICFALIDNFAKWVDIKFSQVIEEKTEEYMEARGELTEGIDNDI